MVLACLLLILSSAIYWFLTKTHKTWEKQNVPTMPNPIPGFGHMLPAFLLKENLSTLTHRIYKECDASIVGFYFLRTPGIVVRDPELVKCVLKTNFLNFQNNSLTVTEKDPVLSKNPFFTTNYHLWQEGRARTMSHLSGKKLRVLFEIAQNVCFKMNDFIDQKLQRNGGIYECELKDHFIRFTGEMVANAAFAVDGRSFEDTLDPSSFSSITRSIFKPSVINGIKEALLFYVPNLGHFLNLSFLQKHTEKYFRETLKAILKVRKQSDKKHLDYLQFVLDDNSENDIENIIADLIIFHADVYETTSTTLAILFYHLSQNKEIQSKLREQISSLGEITYESLKSLTYLDQIIFEAMRKTPPLGVQTKLCTKEITIKGSDGIVCHVKPGDHVYIPTVGLHNDAKYWKDPKNFDPDRFSTENRANRHKFVFLPFGEGPRMCIGMRLGIILTKLCAASILSKFSINHSSKTITPLEFEGSTFLTHFRGGFWGCFEKILKST